MKHNLKHKFILTLHGVNQDTPMLEDILFEAGCNDALISYKNGGVSLIFDREAPNLETAVISAIEAIKAAPIHVKIDHNEWAH